MRNARIPFIVIGYRPKLMPRLFLFKYLIQPLLYFAVLFTALTSFAAPSSLNMQSSINAGEQFLLGNFALHRYTLSCSAIGNTACPVKNSGKLFVLNWVAQALDKQLTPDMQSHILALVNDERKNPDWLWGYNGSVLIDSDDTANALHLLLTLHQPINPRDLQRFYKPNAKGYSTLITPHVSKLVTFASEENNDGIHSEVNANIFHLLKRADLNTTVNYELARQFQSPDGYWEGYFYPGKYYATYLNLTLLCPIPHYASTVKRGLQFIKSSQHANGSWGSPGNAYETALATLTLLTCHTDADSNIQKGIRYLLSSQEQNGAWSTPTPIWAFVGHDDPVLIWTAYDHENTLTTAFVVYTIKRYQLYHAQTHA